MSVQYFQLWFKNDYGVDPRTLAILNVVTTLTVAFMTYTVTNELATRFGTVKVVVTIRLIAVSLLWAMVVVRPIQILLVREGYCDLHQLIRVVLANSFGRHGSGALIPLITEEHIRHHAKYRTR
mmetsp:Transcript_15341/g.12791  ORF Transcript_15341/g.12791 Transcript_15341/m.12791 type:complete len:124 (+) Transcript_15341:197-568(+)